MSQFFTKRYAALTPYTPGEQPQDRRYIKLNTNESPFPPSPSVLEAAKEAAGTLQLYSDPECKALREKMAAVFGVSPSQVLMTNGSDEGLNFAFMAFADEYHPLAFPDISYGFYPVFAELNHIPYTCIPLKEDFSIDAQDYVGIGKTIVIANPNAPTGIRLSLQEIARIAVSNPKNMVVIDEAYVDFGGESAVGMISEFKNLLIIGTFSKSRSMAGARLGYCIGNEELIRDLNTIKYSTNPYNINRMTSACGIAALQDNDYYMANCKVIMENRRFTAEGLEKLGFTVLPSCTNFLFAKKDGVSGEALYRALKSQGILVRHFSAVRIADFIRITIGTKTQMDTFLETIQNILEVQL